MILLAFAAFVFVNIWTFAAFALDKRRAVDGGWRVRESTLLSLAAAGGSPGAYWARRRLRHKTRKQPFGMHLDLIAMVQAGLVLGLSVAFAF